MSSSKNLEFEKTAFLSKSNSAFIEEMYLKFVNNDPSLPDSWKIYFDQIGDEADIILNEINGPSWSPSKKVSIRKLQNSSKITLEDRSKVFSMIDKLVKINVIHKNKAANLKSNLSQLKIEDVKPKAQKTTKKSSVKNTKKEEKSV